MPPSACSSRSATRAITTRRLAEEAGANQGLVHYYFGSMENLLVRVLERFTERLIVRQRAMYAADLPFIEKWRQAMRYLDEDFASGYQKVWYELQAMAWNRPELRERIAHVTTRVAGRSSRRRSSRHDGSTGSTCRSTPSSRWSRRSTRA